MSIIANLLAAGRQQIPPEEARLLLSHVLGRSHAWLLAHDDESLSAAQAARFQDLLSRRVLGEPIAYLLGSKEFYGREFQVSPAVLIPRPETELLVELAVAQVKGLTQPRILDMGTGTGCIATTLALELPHAEVTALDQSAAALAVAQANARRLGAQVRWLQSDWYAALEGGRFDLIVSNPPYIAQADAHLTQGDLRFEPVSALAAGNDGLDDLRQIVGNAKQHLNTGGWLLCEHGFDQASAMATLLEDARFDRLLQAQDLAGIVRVSGACASF